MAKLFGIETPEEIRARIGKTGREQDLNLASLPAGRGTVALASQLGRGAVEGVGKLFGVQTEAQKQVSKIRKLQSAVETRASEKGINRKKDPIKFMQLQAQVFAEEGETEAATKSLAFANQLNQIMNLPNTALTTVARQVFGLGPTEILTPEAAQWLKQIQEMQTQRDAGLIPDKPQAGPNLQEKAATAIDVMLAEEIEVEGESGFSTTDLNDDDFFKMRDWVAGRVAELQAKTKKKGAAPLSENDAMSQAIKEATKGLTRVPGTFNIGGYGDTDLKFEPTRIFRDEGTKREQQKKEGSVNFQDRK